MLELKIVLGLTRIDLYKHIASVYKKSPVNFLCSPVYLYFQLILGYFNVFNLLCVVLNFQYYHIHLYNTSMNRGQD